MIDFELQESGTEVIVRLSGYDRGDMIPMLGYIINTNILSSSYIRYFMNVFQKSCKYSFCEKPEDMELKSLQINPSDISFVLQQKEESNKFLRYTNRDYAEVGMSASNEYDWCCDKEVFNYIESEERFKEPEEDFRLVIGNRGR